MSDTETKPAEYTTTDFYTTAILRTLEFVVKEVRNEGPGKKVKRFVFVDTPELRAAVLEYMNGTLEGNLRSFRNAIENVKDMVHSG